MADDIKRTECVKVCFTERAFIDLGRLAAHEDRKVADLVHSIVRRHLYGNYAAIPLEAEGTNAD